MPYFTKKELIMSLFFPVIVFLWGTYEFVFGIPWGRDLAEVGFWGWLFPLIGLAKLLVGGVLPVVLTLRLKIRTDSYLLIRLIVIVVVYALNRFIENYAFPGSTTVTFFALHMIVNATALLLQILTFKKLDTSSGERAVLILSDPILWWAVYYLAYYIEIFIIFG